MTPNDWAEAAAEWDDIPTAREITPSMQSLINDLPRLIREKEERLANYDRQ